jgi:hypothetical protein
MTAMHSAAPMRIDSVPRTSANESVVTPSTIATIKPDSNRVSVPGGSCASAMNIES